MFVLGLTGSIGMGKSTTAGLFREASVPTWDADQAVHALYEGEAVPLVRARFPGAVADGRIDRAALGAIVQADPAALRDLEAIVHPLVREREIAFVRAAAAGRHPFVVLDVPLLLETGGQARVDAVVVASAPAEVQRERVLARPGMSEARFLALLGRQMPDAEKRARAHFVVDTGHGLERARGQVRAILRALAGRFGRRHPGSAAEGRR